MMICMECGRIKIYKIVILISILTSLLSYAKPFKCGEKIYARLDNYIVKMKKFEKYNKCFEKDSVIINTKTNQRIDLLGKVYGLKYFYLSKIKVLQVQTFAGTHTRIVSFFKIGKDGKLSLLVNGSIGSDIGEPLVFNNYFLDTLTVTKYFSKSKKNCRYLMEDIFKYKNEKLIKTIEGRIVKGCK